MPRSGRDLAQVRDEAAERVEPGVTHLEVAEHAEDAIRELGGKPAFPVNISIDEEAAHATPSATTTRRSAKRWSTSTSASTSTGGSPTPP